MFGLSFILAVVVLIGTPSFKKYYFTKVRNRTDYYREQYEMMVAQSVDLESDINKYKANMLEYESDYQNALFDVYWNNRCNSVSQEAALASIEKNENSSILKVMFVANNVILFEQLISDGKKWLQHTKEFIPLLEEQKKICEKQAELKIPIIKIDPEIKQRVQSLQEEYLLYQKYKEKGVGESIVKSASENAEIVDNNGVRYSKKSIKRVQKDLENYYARYEILPFESRDILELLPEIDSDTSLSDESEKFKLGFINNRLSKTRLDVMELIEKKKYSQVISVLKMFLDGDSENGGIIGTIKDLSRTTKERSELLDSCDRLRNKITDICAKPFIREFDDAIYPIIIGNYSQATNPIFWQNLIDTLQGIKRSIEFTKCSEFTPQFKKRFDQINEKLRIASGHDKGIEVYYARFIGQIKEIMPESWSALQYYNLATKLKLEEKYQDAIKAIDDALKIESDNEDYKRLKKDLINIINSNALYESALQKYEAALRGNDVYLFREAISIIHEAQALVDDEKFRKKEKEINNHINAEELYEAAQKYASDEKYSEADESIEKALNIFNDERFINMHEHLQNILNAVTFYDSAVSLKGEKEYSKALAEIEKAIVLLERAEKLMPEGSRLKMKIFDFKDAVQRLDNNQNAENLYASAKNLMADKNYDDALFEIDKAIHLVPENRDYAALNEKLMLLKAEEIYASAKKFMTEKNYDDALAEIVKARKLAPDNKEYIAFDETVTHHRAEDFFATAKNFKEEKNYSRALTAVEEALNLLSDNKEYDDFKEIVKELESVQKLLNAEKYREAYSSLKDNIKQYPNEEHFKCMGKDLSKILSSKKNDYAEKCYNQAMEAQKEKKYSRAMYEILKALSLFPNNEKYQKAQAALIKKSYDLAVNYQKNNRFSESVQEINKVLSFFPDNKEFLTMKNTILKDYQDQISAFQKNEQYSEALSEINKAMQLFPDDKNLLGLKKTVTDEFFQPGETGKKRIFVINGVEFPVVWCPPTNNFFIGVPRGTRGSHPEEWNVHSIRLTSGFWMMATEVTNKQWNAVMQMDLNNQHSNKVPKVLENETKSDDPLWYLDDDSNVPAVFADEEVETKRYSNRYETSEISSNSDDNLPKTNITWNDCNEFCQKLKKMGIEASLPTEAQWEFACRAGSSVNQNEAIINLGWTKENSNDHVHPVAQKIPNNWGLYDMHGNVFEWCKDYYSEYRNTAQINPVGPVAGDRLVLRGGSFKIDSIRCRSTNRWWSKSLSEKNDNIGARFVFGKQDPYNYNGNSISQSEENGGKIIEPPSVTNDQPDRPVIRAILNYGKGKIPFLPF